MTEAEIYEALNEIFRDVLVNDDISLRPETTSDHVEGWDSFTHVILMVAAEGRFGIKIATQEVEQLKNVGALVKLIRQKLG